MWHTPRVVVPLTAVIVLLMGSALPVDAALPLRAKRCGARITESFRLKNNLTCAGDALRIRASRITIDLNGKTLTGDGDEGDFGIDNTRGFDRVKITTGPDRRRSLITSFYVGVQVGPGGNRNTVKRIRVESTTHDAIDFDGGNYHRVDNTLVSGAGDEGIELNGNGGRIFGNGVGLSAGLGIKVEGDGNVIDGNTTSINGGSGISVDGGNNTVDENQVQGNGGDGIHILGFSNTVTGNTVCSNGGEEILDEGSNTTVAGNSVSDAC